MGLLDDLADTLKGANEFDPFKGSKKSRQGKVGSAAESLLDMEFAGGDTLRGSFEGLRILNSRSANDSQPSIDAADIFGADGQAADEESILKLVADTIYPQRMAAIKEAGGVISPEDHAFFAAYSRIRTGKASKALIEQFNDTVRSSALAQKWQTGELDDINEMTKYTKGLYTDITDQDLLAGLKGEQATSAADTQSSDLADLYNEQIKAQAEQEALKFRQDGISTMLSLVPSEFRLQFFMGLAQQDPTIGKAFGFDFGSGAGTLGIGGSSGKGTPADILLEKLAGGGK